MRVLAALSLAALAPCFLAPAPLAPLTRLRTGEKSGHERLSPPVLSGGPLLLGALACVGASVARARGRCTVRAWPWEEEDPYAKCTALKLQIGMQFSKNMLTTLNKLADGADTSSDAGLHQLLLDVVLALKRAETTWRYADCEQLLFDAEDEGRAAAGKLQRWGLEAQEKWGDGDWEKDKESRMTEYFVVSLMLSCYGAILEEGEDKVRSGADVKKILGAISEVQEDELLQLDVQWIPEEEGDSLSAMEVTMKFPELVMI